MPDNPHLGAPDTTPIWTQYEIMRKLAERSAKREFGSYLLPIIPFNPKRQVYENNARALVAKAIENGFVGVKLYPPVGFLPTGNAQMPEHQHEKVSYAGKHMWLGEALDVALDELYAFCEENDVPIMAHANRSNGFSEDAAWCASAWGWSEVLKQHGGLRLNLAHFGHMEGADTWDPGEPSDTCIMWAKHIAYLMERHQVFADIGNSELAFDPVYAERYLAFLQEVLLPTSSNVARRMMYGSDFWMNVIHQDWADYYQRVQERLVSKVTSIENWPEYFNRANALCFLGFVDEAGKPRSEALAHKRALAFHKQHGGEGQLPGWLTQGVTG
jgi:predicted TIM-barrel fold metal-dependent hydrolase